MDRRSYEYWLLHTAMTEIAQTACTGDKHTCPHCIADTALGMVHSPSEEPDREGLDYSAVRVSSAPYPRLYKSPEFVGT